MTTTTSALTVLRAARLSWAERQMETLAVLGVRGLPHTTSTIFYSFPLCLAKLGISCTVSEVWVHAYLKCSDTACCKGVRNFSGAVRRKPSPEKLLKYCNFAKLWVFLTTFTFSADVIHGSPLVRPRDLLLLFVLFASSSLLGSFCSSLMIRQLAMGHAH